MKLNKNYSCLLASIIGNLPESLILVTLPVFSEPNPHSPASLVQGLWHAWDEQWDNMTWSVDFQSFKLNSSLRKNTKYSEDDTVGAVLYSGRCEMQLLREAQRYPGRNAISVPFQPCDLTNPQATPISAKMRMIQHVLRDLELDQKSLNFHLCTSPYLRYYFIFRSC